MLAGGRIGYGSHGEGLARCGLERGEYLRDDANFGGSNQWKLGTATLTADYKPLPNLPNLIVRWDNRWEKSNQHIFGADAKGTADTADDIYTNAWFESVIGVVVTTAP